MADWANLPLDLLMEIAKDLNILEEDFISIDFVNFGAVCKSWQLATKLTLPSQYPYVMLTDIAEKNFPKLADELLPGNMLAMEVSKNEQIDGMYKRGFFSFLTSKTYEIKLPQATRRKCVGVGFGWLLTIGYDDFRINLLHPFTRKQLAMPNMLSFQWDWNVRPFPWAPSYAVHFFVNKAVMSSNPLSRSYQDSIIFVIYSPLGKLAFARPGDEMWTHLNSEKYYVDIIYFKGNFYAIDEEGHVYVCDINDENNLKVTKISCSLPVDHEPKTYSLPGGHEANRKYLYMLSHQNYLVESSGYLLVVVRYRCNSGIDPKRIKKADLMKLTYHTVIFSIYRLEEYQDGLDKYPYRLRKIDNLGNQSLFLGVNASASFPSSQCINPNCIYYSEDDSLYYSKDPCGGGRDTGVFDVKSNSTTSHYAAEFRSHLTPPLWLV